MASVNFLFAVLGLETGSDGTDSFFFFFLLFLVFFSVVVVVVVSY